MNCNNKNISVIDFDKICRVCMSEENLINIYNKCDSKDDNCIFEKLACCTMVSEKDQLPDKICFQCLDELNAAYKFFRKSEITDVILHKLLEKSKQSDQKQSSLPHRKKEYTNILKTENIENDISSYKNDTGNLENDIVGKNYIRSDNYFQKVCKNKNSSPIIQIEISCNQNNTDTEICDTSSNTNGTKFKRKHTYECIICSEKFATYRPLRVHRMTVHGAKFGEIPCQVCAKFINYKEFRQHLQCHKEYKPFTCDMCSAKFRLKANLHRHMLSHTSAKPYSCEQCDKTFSRLETLRKHSKKHQSTSINDDLIIDKSSFKAEEHSCHICNRCFSSKASLNQHSLIHDDKKYLCSFCGKVCATRGGLLSHVKIHTGIKPFQCSYCPKSFAQSSTLKTHMYTHTGERPYTCEFCSKSFTQSHHLTYHIRMHSGVKPYKCSICAKSFVTSGTLKVHMRIHTGEKPYVCEVCFKRFHDSSSMKKHVKVHSVRQDTVVHST